MTEESPFPRDNRKSAEFSDCCEYRYRLTRRWNTSKPACAFITLNPGTANQFRSDPTIRRCIGYAKAMGYGTLVVGNLFALRSADPECLYEHDDPVGPANDEHLQEIAECVDQVVAAWGPHGCYMDRGREVTELLDGELVALDVEEDGHPSHPLYLPKDVEPEPYQGPGGVGADD